MPISRSLTMSATHLFSIPPELLLEALDFLDCKSLLACRAVRNDATPGAILLTRLRLGL